jgi:hypothetical protein
MDRGRGISRRHALQQIAAGSAALALTQSRLAKAREPQGLGPADRPLVRDRLWVWAHDAGSYDNAWGLPGNSRLMPVEGARYLGVPNIIMIRYGGKPAVPFDEYAKPFRDMQRVYWSIAGAGGETSQEEREHVFRLAAQMPNLVGVFMDDFYHDAGQTLPQWLAANNVTFPVTLTLRLPEPIAATRLELTQSHWHSGDYRSADFAVDVPDDARGWREVGRGTLENRPEATKSIDLPGQPLSALRIRILGTHDHEAARSCGLRRVRLWAGDREISWGQTKAEASSSYAGFDLHAVLRADEPDVRPATAALTPEQLQAVRRRLTVGDRRLDLGVTLYTHQLSPRILTHLDLCDVVSLWTWKAQDLAQLESNFARLEQLAPRKRVLLGCYMWDFGTNRPMPVEWMQKQTSLGLQWLQAGEVEGLIFLATNICDLKLETVEWTRKWIAEVGPQRL